MAKFLVVARGSGQVYANKSPQEMQQIVQKYMAWTAGLRDAGRMLHAERLTADGRVVRGAAGKMTVTDGPFAESKEVLGGFWLLEAASYDEVLAFLKDHPHLEAGTQEPKEDGDHRLHGGAGRRQAAGQHTQGVDRRERRGAEEQHHRRRHERAETGQRETDAQRNSGAQGQYRAPDAQPEPEPQRPIRCTQPDECPVGARLDAAEPVGPGRRQPAAILGGRDRLVWFEDMGQPYQGDLEAGAVRGVGAAPAQGGDGIEKCGRQEQGPGSQPAATVNHGVLAWGNCGLDAG